MLRPFGILCLVALWFSATVLVDAKVADVEFLNKQKIIHQLLWRPDQPEIATELYNLGKNYDIGNNLGSYEHEHYVKEFLRIYEKGMLPRGEIFSVFYSELLDQAVALFRVFYYAKDFDTLYKTAAWAKIYVNEGIFTYALSVAVVQLPLTQHIRIPALHELYPYLYFDSQVLRKVYDAKSSTDSKDVSLENPIIVHANSSKFYKQETDELNYFTESVEANDLLYMIHLSNPFWISTKEFNITLPNRGEAFLKVYVLLYARYYMERLCNDMNEVEDFDWTYPIPYGYQPNFNYHNGLPFPHRDEYAEFPSYNYKWLETLKNIDSRLSVAIDMRNVVHNNGTFSPLCTEEDVSILGDLIEGNADSVNHEFYGSFDRDAKNVLGYSPEPIGKYKILPSILQHFGVDQKDPMYWSLVKKIVGYYEKFMSYLPKYTYDQLALPGVKIESVDIEKIMTFFSPKDYLVSSAVKIRNADDETFIKVRMNRLKHKDYTYTITVNSEEELTATIRVFLGPKCDVNNEDIDLMKGYKYFMPVDMWNVDLKPGSNKFVRSNLDNVISGPDELSGDKFYAKILRAIEGKETYVIPRSLYAYPESVIIPKGKREGYPYQLFVFVGPYSGEEFYPSKSPVIGERDYAPMPSLYPLDRPTSSNFTELPNVFFKEFYIFHVDEAEINRTI